MSETTLLVFAIVGLILATALPLLVYARLPQRALDLLSQHGRFSGLASAEQAGRSGNSPVSEIGSLRGQTA
jgi:hypothetical protein